MVSGCDTPGCLALPVEYEGASIAQITKLVDISLACEQFIRYDCYDSKLLKDGKKNTSLSLSITQLRTENEENAIVVNTGLLLILYG